MPNSAIQENLIIQLTTAYVIENGTSLLHRLIFLQGDKMAERRMFTKKIIDSDAFTALPPTTQALYFHLCMNADDDGFNNRIRQAMFNAHADQNDFNLLVQYRFIIPFDNGIIVIKHWRMHNLIRSDRYHETEYIEEKATLVLKENGVYTDDVNHVTTKRQPNDNQRETEDSIGKDSIGKDKEKAKSTRFVPPTLEQVQDYCRERGNNIDAERFIDFYESKGWMVGKNKMEDWKASVRTWEKRENKSAPKQEEDSLLAMIEANARRN